MKKELYNIITQKPHVFVVGKKNQGKTTVVKFLVHHFSRKGYRVAAWKHSSHDHPVDKPDSDSDLFRKAGATISIFQSLDGTGIYFPRENEEFAIQLLETMINHIDILIIESFSTAPGPKILVYKNLLPDPLPENILATIGPKPIIKNIPNFLMAGEKLTKFLEELWFE